MWVLQWDGLSHIGTVMRTTILWAHGLVIYVKRAPTDGKYELTRTVAIAHEENEDTTTGEGLFILETP